MNTNLIHDEKLKKKFLDYEFLILKWNKIHNLGGRLSSNIIQNYIHESLYPLSFIQPFYHCIDIGSGAGFPALPMALKLPQSFFSLIEPRKKRYAFLQIAALQLEIKNIRIYPFRLEDIKITQEHEKNLMQVNANFIQKADLITSRGVMKTMPLIHKSRHLLKKGGSFLFFKGERLKLEINEDTSAFKKFNQRIYFYKSLEELKI